MTYSDHMEARIAVCSWSLKPRTPAELIERLRRVGISAVQLALSPIVHDAEHWADALNELQAVGIRIVSGMMAMAGEDYSTLETIAKTGGVRQDATWFANRQHAELLARLAHRANLEMVSFHAGFIPEEPRNAERARILDRLRTVADIFDQHGITVAFETGQETAETLAAALDELDCSNVGVNFDPANMILYGKGDPIAAFKLLKSRVRQIHVKDAQPTKIRGTWGTEMPVGQGAVNWDEFFRIAMDVSPPLNFVIEREAKSATEADIIKARDIIDSHLSPRMKVEH